MTNSKKILIAVPVAVYAENKTMESIYNLTIPYGVTTELRIIEGYTVDTARNKLVKESLDGGFDKTFFVDSDIILPKDALVKLLEVDTDIVTGWYIKKMVEQNITELYAPVKGDEKQMGNILEKDMPAFGAFDIVGCGFGCTLIDNEVIKKVIEVKGVPFEYVHTKDRICSEDIDFCIKAREAGYKIAAVANLRCDHIGKRTF